MSQSGELFSLSSTTPEGSLLHGVVTVHGSAGASAEFRRGIDLSAGFNFGATVGGDVGGQVEATFSAGVGAGGGLAFQAYFPLDLFTSAGVVARFRAQLEAAAYIRAAVRLRLDDFQDRVRLVVPPGPMARLLEIFLEEAKIEAGMWARAAFAAEAFGEATLTGSLFGNSASRPGFSFSLQYGVGWMYGSGYQFLTNIGIEDPRRLLDRTGALLTDLTVERVNEFVGSLSANDAQALQPAVASFQLLLPLATRSAFQLGVKIAASGSTSGAQDAVTALVDSVIHEGQSLLLRTATDLAGRELARLFNAPSLAQSIKELDQSTLTTAAETLDDVVERIRELSEIDFTEVRRWVPVLIESLPHFERLLSSGIMEQEFVDTARYVLAKGWAAAVLLNRLAEWLEVPESSTTDLFHSGALTATAPAEVQAIIRAQLNKAESDSLAYSILFSSSLVLSSRTPSPRSCRRSRPCSSGFRER